jgi:hypothetical protein
MTAPIFQGANGTLLCPHLFRSSIAAMLPQHVGEQPFVVGVPGQRRALVRSFVGLGTLTRRKNAPATANESRRALRNRPQHPPCGHSARKDVSNKSDHRIPYRLMPWPIEKGQHQEYAHQEGRSGDPDDTCAHCFLG